MNTFPYDIHIATEGSSNTALEKALEKLGYEHDELVVRGLIFNKKTARYYSSCPLIGIHMSKKIATLSGVQRAAKELDRLMRTVGKQEVGYYHAEKTHADFHEVVSVTPQFKAIRFPFKTMEAQPRTQDKTWDIHVRFKEKNLSSFMKQTLLSTGLYYMSRWKTVGGKRDRYAVYTIQSITNIKQGEQLYKELVFWLGMCGFPKFDAKLETTTHMKRFNNPLVVPPTIAKLVVK